MWKRVYFRLKKWITLRKLRWKFRKKSVQTISFSNAVANVQNILICLPWEDHEFRVARYVLKHLPQNDSYHQITYVVPEEHAPDFPARTQDTIIAVNGRGRDHLGRFTRDAETSILNKQYQAAADLNITFDLGTSILCKKSGAPLRIGFSSEHADIFFNVEIEKTDQNFLLENAYRSIQRLLALEQPVGEDQ